ncbi:S8 family serine peptidase [Phytohabitans suffuscus]|uniref:Peptidase S8/S53 domain-containing protein n=1 Tax=Phytohabitans suffuscus TaxID=624315 RepID=A0A6F8YJQ2_9ACTN|nr:S8 family serine peptidase [Phytohabitans suffuscus]BCB86306.1 hypothetical protein Psuf_036190 [Phytohabitans suffuscus]
MAGVVLAAVATTVGIAGTSAAQADPPEPLKKKGLGAQGAPDKGFIKDSYIVVLKDRKLKGADVKTDASTLTTKYGGAVRQTFSRSLRGYSATMTAAQAKELAADPEVARVEQNRKFTKSDATQANPPSWGLDRIDQTWLPLNKQYTYPNTASNVTAYVIDTGIRISHQQFGGRASYGIDTIDGDAVADDCDGHGTHVAGTVGGSGFGVAKGVKLVAVRVLDCNGSGSTESVLAGVEWVTANAVKPAVANMSLGVFDPDRFETVVDDAVAASIASGVTYAIAAGNDGADACDVAPARVPGAITVGATDEADFTAFFSNFGPCLDIHAPGNNILSSIQTSDTASARFSGTSMASPHVAGAAAHLLSANPGWTPAQVTAQLVKQAQLGGARGFVEDTTTRLLQVGERSFPNTVTGIRANANNKFVTAENAGKASLIANRVEVGAWERFDIVNVGGGFVALRSKINNRYVTAESAGAKPLIANRTAVGDWEKFTLSTNGDGSFSLRANANGRFVTAESAGAKALIANRTGIGVWERFWFATPPTQISLRANINNKIVTAENAGKNPLIANRAAAGAWEAFDIVDIGGGWVALRAKINSRYVVAETAGSKALIANRKAVGDWEAFYLWHWGDGSVLLVANANFNFVNAPNSGNSPLIANFPFDGTTIPPASTHFFYLS